MRTGLLRHLAAASLLAATTAVTTLAADAQPASITGPAVAWKFDTGREVVASPLLADGILYCGSTGYAFYAIDAATGALVWKADAKNA